MIQWIREDWGNYFDNPPTPGSDGKILVADVHRAQQTPTVKSLLSKCKTSLVNIPPELTSYIQVLDVSINKPFKDEIIKQSEKHVEENIDRYAEGKIPVSEHRILLPKWVADVDPAVIIRGFKKCGYSVALDGSENDRVVTTLRFTFPAFLLERGRFSSIFLIKRISFSSTKVKNPY